MRNSSTSSAGLSPAGLSSAGVFERVRHAVPTRPARARKLAPHPTQQPHDAAPTAARRLRIRRAALDVPTLLAFTTLLLLALGARGPVIALLIAANIAIHPGATVVARLGPLPLSASVAMHVSIGIAVWAAAAHVMLSLEVWRPTAGTALLLAVLAALRVAAMPRIPASGLTTEDRTMASSPPRPYARDRLTDSLRTTNRIHLGVVALGIVLWWWATTRWVEPPIGLGGWARELPPMWWAAALLLAASAAHAVSTRTPHGCNVAASVASLIAVLYLTPVLVSPTIRYPWSYKHLGVIRLFDETGRFHHGVDVYQTFSGAFGLGALVRGASGVDPSSYASWAQPIGELLVCVAVVAFLLAVTGSRRVAYLGALVYLLTNWVGQNYFAAQTLASLLAVTTLALTVMWFSRSATPAAVRTRSIRAAVIGALVFGILLIHPLTPIAVLAPLALAWVAGYVRDRRLAIAVIVAVGVWSARNAVFLFENIADLGFGGSIGANAAGNSVAVAPPAEAAAITRLTRAFSAGVWALAACGAMLAVWARRRIGWAVLAGAAPFGIPLVQSYGGEAIYRVYLYSLPMVAGLVAWGLCSLAPVDRRGIGRFALTATVLGALLIGMVTVHYGREHINRVDPDEVAMANFVGATIDGPTLIAQFSSGYPAQSTANYPDHQISPTYTPSIAEMLADIAAERPRLDVTLALDEVADDLRALTDQTPFVVVSPGMVDVVRTSGTWPVADIDEATAMLSGHPQFELRHRIGNTSLFAVVSPRSTNSPAARTFLQPASAPNQ